MRPRTSAHQLHRRCGHRRRLRRIVGRSDTCPPRMQPSQCSRRRDRRRRRGSLGRLTRPCAQGEASAISPLSMATTPRSPSTREARQAREYVEALIRDCRIDCGLRTSARFIAAHSPRAFARQRDNLESLRVAWARCRACQTGGAASGDRLRRFLRRHQAAEFGYASAGLVAAGVGPRCDWRRRRAAPAGAGAGGAPQGQRL